MIYVTVLQYILFQKGYTLEKAEISYIPKTTTELTNPEDITKTEKLIDALEDNNYVQNVCHTWEMRDVDEEEKSSIV